MGFHTAAGTTAAGKATVTGPSAITAATGTTTAKQVLLVL